MYYLYPLPKKLSITLTYYVYFLLATEGGVLIIPYVLIILYITEIYYVQSSSSAFCRKAGWVFPQKPTAQCNLIALRHHSFSNISKYHILMVS